MTIPRRELDFLLYELLDAENLCAREHFSQHDRAIFDAAMDTAERLARELFAPHAALADAEEPTCVDGRVILPEAVRAAVVAYSSTGLLAAPFDAEHGGAQLPYTVSQACSAMLCAANISTFGYPFLTAAAARLLARFGSPLQRERYLGPMLEGRFFGTMCLSEPAAGSSLADVQTAAAPRSDGTWSIRGTKMWISAGEHELGENIVHLVLARSHGAPPGTRGISLFAVPRFRRAEDGGWTVPNDVSLVGLNHKLGYRGTVNTVLAFGEQDDCHGELIGALHEGLSVMFHMMNEARIGVGLGAAALGMAGYHYSARYARERTQGRRPDDKDPTRPPVAIIEHADVRRMLLQQKALVEGGLALVMYCAWLVDHAASATDEGTRAQATSLLEVLTPIAKAWPSEHCTRANNLAIQVLGGYGYSREFPVERYWRDNRLNAIHEGTNGIQAIDLLGRKVLRDGGHSLRVLLLAMQQTTAAARAVEVCAEYAAQLDVVCGGIERSAGLLGAVAAEGRWGLALANAELFARVAGHTVIAWMWLRQAMVAADAIARGAVAADRGIYEGKLWACRYFFRWELPKVEHWRRLLDALDDTALNAPIESL